MTSPLSEIRTWLKWLNFFGGFPLRISPADDTEFTFSRIEYLRMIFFTLGMLAMVIAYFVYLFSTTDVDYNGVISALGFNSLDVATMLFSAFFLFVFMCAIFAEMIKWKDGLARICKALKAVATPEKVPGIVSVGRWSKSRSTRRILPPLLTTTVGTMLNAYTFKLFMDDMLPESKDSVLHFAIFASTAWVDGCLFYGLVSVSANFVTHYFANYLGGTFREWGEVFEEMETRKDMRAGTKQISTVYGSHKVAPIPPTPPSRSTSRYGFNCN